MKALDFAGKNAYLISTIVAILQSAQINLFSENKNPPLNFSYVGYLVLSTCISAICTLGGSYPGIDSNISAAKTKAFELVGSPMFSTDRVDEIEENLDILEKNARRHCIRSSIIETVLVVTLILLIAYKHKNLNGLSRFISEVLFYMLQALDYGYTSKKLYDIYDESKRLLSLFDESNIQTYDDASLAHITGLANIPTRGAHRNRQKQVSPDRIFDLSHSETLFQGQKVDAATQTTQEFTTQGLRPTSPTQGD